ncbi:MAG: hypothetical protein AB8B74_12525 [Crocinitomicaceae bacterium]
MASWRIHFSAFEAINIVEANSIVSMASNNGIIQYDLLNDEITTFTVTDGLSDKKISAIEAQDNIIIVGYSNGNIDVIEDNTITNIPWLKRALISGGKTVNNINIEGSTAYVSTEAGLLVVDILKKEISDTYIPFSGANVLDMVVFQDSIFLGTDKGIHVASKTTPFLNDPSNWQIKSGLPTYINNNNVSEIEVFNNELIIAFDTTQFNKDSVFRLTSAGKLVSLFTVPTSINRLAVNNGNLVVTRFANTIVFNENFEQLENIYDYSFGPPPKPAGAVYINEELWIADANNGLCRAKDPFSNNKQVYANSPYLDGCYKIDINNGKVAVAGGGLTDNLKSINLRRGIYLFENEKWINVNSRTNPVELADSLNWDIIGISVNPKNESEVAFSSYSKGGLKILDGITFKGQYDKENSPLEGQLNNETNMIIPDLKYDNDGNLWLVNAGTEPLKMLDTDEKWHTYNLGAAANNKFPLKLFIDSRGYKWIAMNGLGIVVYDDNGTYDDLSDDRKVTIRDSKGFGSLPSIEVKSIAEDLDGEIWIGTANGLAVFYSVATIFDGNFGDSDASQVVVYDSEKEVYVPIFDKVTVTAIAVDGGNRKWIGTNASGVFCMTPNGKTELLQFGTENSPIISNSIFDIKINHENGEAFFATSEGLISYRTDASQSDNTFSAIKVFPNPVRPEYKGIITVQGLGYESQVRITDVSGNLIYQTVSNGGTVTWDGNRLTGERVQSGVYLVWSARVEGKGDNVAKILIIN